MPRVTATGFTHVNQFHPGSAAADAITGDMLEIQRVLRQAGFESEIFAQDVGVGLEKKLHPISEYSGDRTSLLILHHSMGFDGFEQIVTLPGRKILRYHNITPAHFFPTPHLRHYADLGRRQLGDYLTHVELAIADSEFNRRDLLDMGYRYTCTVPILFRPEGLLAEQPDAEQMRSLMGTDNLLFVGRICSNKKQEDLVGLFDTYFHEYNPNARLLLVGSWQDTPEYAEQLRFRISARRLGHAVCLAGKLTSAALVACYRSSVALLCASEHEGFCVPLVEAMAFDLPIVAFRAAAVPETLGNAGLLLDTKNPRLWSEVIEELRRNTAFRKTIIQRQRRRLAELHADNSGARLLELIHGLSTAPAAVDVKRPILQVQGPFETSYSLAVVNRNLALATDSEGTFDVSIHCTEGPGDYLPKEADLADKPHARWLWKKSTMLTQEPDVVIRNVYPPRVHDIRGKLRLLYFAWEDSLIPKDWANAFNTSLDGVLVPSLHVETVLRGSGVTLPIYLLHYGINESFFTPAAERPASSTRRRFTFLHVSSGFPRKGIDVLLEAFFTEFAGSEDVALVVKTFPNIHNDVASQIAAWKVKTIHAPECVHIDDDIDQRGLEQLYQVAHCAVYPSRAEGFGLPIAEAMAKRIPVITTGYGGHIDFCSTENSFLLDYRMVPSQSHLNVPEAQWAEPDVKQLRTLMRLVFDNDNSPLVTKKVELAFRKITEEFRWSLSAAKLRHIVAQIGNHNHRVAGRLAMVTSWDSRCGIAEYTRYLLAAVVEKQPGLQIEILSSPGEGLWPNHIAPAKVCWGLPNDDNLQALRRELATGAFDAVHFQFNFCFFPLEPLATVIRDLKASGKRVLITFHATADTTYPEKPVTLRHIADALRTADVVFVHSTADRERLAGFGIRENVCLTLHGGLRFPEQDRTIRKEFGIPLDPVIGTFGFLLPHKGLLELLRALRILQREFAKIGLLAQCALHRDPVSQDFERTVRHAVRELELNSAVVLSTAFLAPEEAVLFLQCADLLVLPYGKTDESTSAAVRFAIAAGRPVITTQQEIFADVQAATYQVSSNDPDQLAHAIRRVLTNPQLADQLSHSAREYAREACWERVAQGYLEYLRHLLHKQ